MKLFKKAKFLKLIMNMVPIAAMLVLIPIIPNDYLLTAIFMGIIVAVLVVKTEKKDLQFLFAGFISMTFLEYFFIQIGILEFHKKSLMGMMPMRLPVFWAYFFVALKRIGFLMSKR